MAIMLRVLRLTSPWQPRYFFGSDPFISPRPRAGLAPSRPCVTQAAQRGYSRRQRSRAAPPRPPGGPAAPGGSGRARSQKKGKKSHLGCFFYPFQSARLDGGSVHVLTDIGVPGSCFLLAPATPRSGEAGLARV